MAFYLGLYIQKASITQSCLTLCNAMDNSLPGSSVHGILQEWVAIPFFKLPILQGHDCYKSRVHLNDLIQTLLSC